MYSHTEGFNTITNGFAMHAQGKWNKPDDTVYPDWVARKSYAVGDKVTYGGYDYTCKTANSDATFTSSKWTKGSRSIGEIAFVIGNGTTENARSNAFVVKWDGSVQEGTDTTASGDQSHAEGGHTTASGINSHAEGVGTTASGDNSHAEGESTVANGHTSHAEGGGTLASGDSSHAEGSGSHAINVSAHAEGSSLASGRHAHSEGSGTFAIGDRSHAEGMNTTASGFASHSEGYGTIANGQSMHAQGTFNTPDETWPEWIENTSYEVGDKVTYDKQGYICTTANSDAKFTDSNWSAQYKNGDIAFVIGNGTGPDNATSNALTVNWDGTQKIAGDLYTNYNFDTNTGNKVATEAYVTEAIAGAGGGGSDEYALKTDTVL